jgi:hypothetical protein
VATLSAWKCGSYLYKPQKFELYIYATRSEYEAKKMARIDQGLRVGSDYDLGLELIKDYELEVIIT